MTYALRTTVTAAHVNADGEVNQVEGELRSVFVSPDDRLMAQIKTVDAVYNVDYCTVGMTPDEINGYATAIAEINRISAEGNEAIKALAADYNAQVDAIYKAM